jgi:hypothetical protein
MMPVPTKNATHLFGKPKEWDESVRGPVRTLSVRVEDTVRGKEFVSTWKPTLEEIQALQDGGTILLTVGGVQPPVALHVEPTEGEDHGEG